MAKHHSLPSLPLDAVLPCPFCGSKRVELHRTNPNACWIRCHRCGATADYSPRRDIAIRNWNRRPIIEGLAKIVIDDETGKGKHYP